MTARAVEGVRIQVAAAHLVSMCAILPAARGRGAWDGLCTEQAAPRRRWDMTSSGSIEWLSDMAAPLSVAFTRKNVMASSRNGAEESRRATGNSRTSYRYFGDYRGKR